MRPQPAIDEFETLAREADAKAAQAEDGSAVKAEWAHIASSWRLVAERMIAERTGGELSGLGMPKRKSARPMGYQQSFFALH